MQWIAAVPNFSDGRNSHTIQSIEIALRSVAGAWLLHTDSNPSANRTVMTIVGSPQAVVEALVRAIAVAASEIDMRVHQGVHPRIGAVDVCPLVPLQNVTINECMEWAKKLSHSIWMNHRIPIYYYEYLATVPERMALPFIRKHEYEGLSGHIESDPRFKPDVGEAVWNDHSGAMMLGVRDILIAYNVNLKTTDVRIAQKIAQEIRESGNGLRLPHVRAIGWFIEAYQMAQVSTNILRYKSAGLFDIFDACQTLAKSHGTEVDGSEIVGLIPAYALAGRVDKMEIPEAIDYLGLNRCYPFNPSEKILEEKIFSVTGHKIKLS